MWVLQIEGGAGDEGLQTFCSYLSDDIRLSQVSCHITYDIDQRDFSAVLLFACGFDILAESTIA